MKTIARGILLGAMLFGLAQAQQSNKAGTTGAQFLKLGVGARGVAMAGATAGLADDASALYWNPSGIVHVRSLTFFAAHTEWFAGIGHQFFGLVLPVGEDHRIGVSATVLNMGKMEITTETSPQGTGDFFEANDVAVGLSYATRLVDFFDFGASVKYISQTIYNESGSSFALDLGTTLRTGYEGIKIGMAFTNFGTTIQLEGRDLRRTYDPNPNNATNVGVSSYLATESWELPINFRVGIGWDLLGVTDAMVVDETNSLRVGIDANHPNDGPENAALGLEYSWSRIVSLRGGYRFNDDTRTWTFGGGLHWNQDASPSFGVDYAYMNLKKLGGVHIFSLGVGL